MTRLPTKPSYEALQSIPKILGEKFPNHSFCLAMDVWTHPHSPARTTYRLSILPGDDGSACSGHDAKTWKSLIGITSELLVREELTHV